MREAGGDDWRGEGTGGSAFTKKRGMGEVDLMRGGGGVSEFPLEEFDTVHQQTLTWERANSGDAVQGEVIKGLLL